MSNSTLISLYSIFYGNIQNCILLYFIDTMISIIPAPGLIFEYVQEKIGGLNNITNVVLRIVRIVQKDIDQIVDYSFFELIRITVF